MHWGKLALALGLSNVWLACGAFAQDATQTPPVEPKIQVTPLPPPIELPPPPSLPADVPNRPLTAEEAVKIALLHQRSITVAKESIEAAQGRVIQAKSGLKPNLSGSGSYAHYDPSATSNTTGFNASATLKQILYDFNHTRDTVRQNEAEVLALEAGLTKAQSDLVLGVKQSFYTLAQNIQLIAVNEANVKNSQDQLALAQAQLSSGLGLPSDVVRAETAVDEAISNLTLARNEAATSRASLALLMGIDPRAPIQPADDSEPTPEDRTVDDFIQTAMKRRPEIAGAESTLQAANLGVSAAKTFNAPTFSANVGLTAKGGSFPPDADTTSIGASVSWDPFDGGLTKGHIQEARAGAVSAEAQLESIRLQVISDVSTAYLNMKSAEQREQTAGSEVANAQESLRLAEGRYRNGLGTFLDAVVAQTALLTAQTNQVNARYAVDQARAALSRAIGAPFEIPEGGSTMTKK